jgi:hypothetical protein
MIVSWSAFLWYVSSATLTNVETYVLMICNLRGRI